MANEESNESNSGSIAKAAFNALLTIEPPKGISPEQHVKDCLANPLSLTLSAKLLLVRVRELEGQVDDLEDHLSIYQRFSDELTKEQLHALEIRLGGG